MDEVVGHFGAGALGRDKGRPAGPDVHRLELLGVLDADAQLFPAADHVVVDRLDTEHIADGRVEGDAGLVERAGLRQPVAQHEGHLERRACTFERRGRQGHDRVATSLAEGVHGLPGGHGRLGAGVDAGEAVLADGGHVHALDQTPVLVGTGGDHQVVVGYALASGGHHRVARRVELGHHLLDPLHASRLQVGIAVAHLADRPDAGGHQGVAGLVVVFLFPVDDGDARTVEQFAQPRGHGQAAKTTAGDHDAGLGLQARCLRRRRGHGRSGGGASGTQQPAASVEFRHGGHAVSWSLRFVRDAMVLTLARMGLIQINHEAVQLQVDDTITAHEHVHLRLRPTPP